MSAQAVRACWVVYSDQALPLLDGEWLVGVDVEPYHFALCVESIEIDVGDDSERTVGGIVGEGREVLEGELAASFPAGRGRCRRRGEGLRGGHCPRSQGHVIACSVLDRSDTKEF